MNKIYLVHIPDDNKEIVLETYLREHEFKFTLPVDGADYHTVYAERSALRDSLRAAMKERDDYKAGGQAHWDGLVALRAERATALAAKEKAERELADEKQKVATLEEYMLQGVAFRDELQASKDVAYRERNQFVLFLTRCFPSHRCKHPESDAAWERGWMNIICVHGPQGQMTWHIHDSELPAFEHLLLEESHWDGHTTEEKYVRLYRCDMNSPKIGALRREVDRLQTNEVVIADERFDMERRLTERAEKAEGALCRAINLIQEGYCSMVTKDDLKGVLPDTAIPCPHEIELKKLKGIR